MTRHDAPREHDFIWLGCQNGRHKWVFIGGGNAGCGPWCSCSVPIHECECGDCDYGDNPEADAVRQECRDTAPREAGDD